MKHPIIKAYEKSLNKQQKRNYQDALIKICEDHKKNNHRPNILIHACCAVCSTVALDVLNQYMNVVVYFYNPNIHPQHEFRRRSDAQRDLIDKFNIEYNADIKFIEGKYIAREFFKKTLLLKDEKEGSGHRCGVCYGMRMEDAAIAAIELGSDYFCTTLTLSPMKNSSVINQQGFDLEEQYDVYYLPSDFKKNGGMQRSKELTTLFDVYRQNYCGCIFGAKAKGVDLVKVVKDAKANK